MGVYKNGPYCWFTHDYVKRPYCEAVNLLVNQMDEVRDYHVQHALESLSIRNTSSLKIPIVGNRPIKNVVEPFVELLGMLGQNSRAATKGAKTHLSFTVEAVRNAWSKELEEDPETAKIWLLGFQIL